MANIPNDFVDLTPVVGSTAKDISGNGKPDRMAGVEARITSLERSKWKMAGVISFLSAAATLLLLGTQVG